MAAAVSLGSATGSPRPSARLRRITASSRLMLAAISAVLSRAIGLLFSIGPLWRVWAVAGPLTSGGNPLTDTSHFPITASRHPAGLIQCYVQELQLRHYAHRTPALR
jgi:hypothetical protein